MIRKPDPPDEQEWDDLGINNRCTCDDYSWETSCPYLEELHPEIDSACECCPYHSHECFLDI